MLKVFDGLLTQIDEELPLGRHVFSLFQHLVPVEDLISFFLVRAQEVVVSDPESDVIVRSIVVVIAAFHTVCLLVGAVETFDELLEGTEFFGYFIVIRKTDDLCDVELKVLTVFMEELLGSQDIGAVTIGDKAEVIREFFESPESHPHGQDAGTDTAVIRDAVAEDGAGSGIDNEPEKALFAFYPDIRFITDISTAAVVFIVINEGLDHKGSCSGIVSDLLVGNGYTVQILQCLGGFPKGQTKVHMHGQAQSHDVGVEGPELQGRGVIRKGTQIDLKEVDSEFPVDVVEFIEIPGLVRIIRMDLLETVEVVGTLLVHAFVNDEELTALDRNKGVAAEGTAEDHVLFYRVGIGKETVTTDLAEKLTFVAVVFVEVDHGSAAARTADILRNVAGLTTVDRLKILAILPAVVL